MAYNKKNAIYVTLICQLSQLSLIYIVLNLIDCIEVRYL